jgi:hypothetical protein
MTALETIKEYALLNDNVWLFKKLEIAELEIQIAAIEEVTETLGVHDN